MSLDRNFGGLIWTNHALRRMQERGIKQVDAWATWRRPDQTRYGKAKGTWVYYRTFPAAGRESRHQRIEVVAKKNEKKQWIILSIWNRTITVSKKREVEKKNFMEIILDRLLGRKG